MSCLPSVIFGYTSRRFDFQLKTGASDPADREKQKKLIESVSGTANPGSNAGGASPDLLDFVKRTATTTYAISHGWAIVLPALGWAGGLGAALLIGAIAGLLPALRAARMSPTDALRTA